MPPRFSKQTPGLMPGVVSRFEPAGGKVLRNDTVSPPLTGFDLNAQQSGEERGLSGRGRKPGQW
ncbi:hypothetical protein V1292_003970 [Bradyrhizobium sp. AZCC 1719]